jgi:hypothetical protein
MQNIFKTYKKTVIILIIILIAVATSLIIIYNLNLTEIEKVSWQYWEQGDERRGELVIKYSIEEGNKRNFLLTNFNINQPVSSVVLLNEVLISNKEYIRFETFYLERTGINSFKVKESIISSSTAYTFSEAVEISKKYDVYKNNPDPEKIFNYPKLNLTPEQKQEQILTPEKIKAGEIEDKAIELCGGVFPPLGDPKLDQFFACYDAKIIELTNAG